MFGSSDKKKKTMTKTSQGSLNSIVYGTKMEGDVECENDIRIDGELIGSLNCQGKLIIGESGSIQGRITCKDAVIQGDFKGEMTVEQVLDVKNSANIQGEITTHKLIVESGAVFNVRCQMGDKAFGNAPGDPYVENKKQKKPA